jgi:AraC-like DNA-binding protein
VTEKEMFRGSSLKTNYFSFNPREILDDYSEQVVFDDKPCQKIAGPLFDVGLRIACLTERVGYDSGMGGEKGRPYSSFTLLLQGSMEIQIGDHQRTIVPGELVWAPVGVRFRRYSKAESWWLYFDFEDVDAWRPLVEAGPYIRKYEQTALMLMQLRAILDARYRDHPKGSRISLASSRFLIRLLQNEIVLVNEGLSDRSEKLDQLMDEIARRPHQEWKVSDMASYLEMSSSHLSSLFKKQFGLSPIEAVIKQRMEKAKQILRKGEVSVQEVAYAVGYKSYCSFSRLFSKHVGRSPRQYGREN